MRGEPNAHVDALRRCTVRIEDRGDFRGSGFFVAPGEVLTCAHVVHGRRSLSVVWQGGSSRVDEIVALPADPGGADYYPFPDVALLSLTEPPVGHECVRLDLEEPASGTPLAVVGWTREARAPRELAVDPVTIEYEGLLVEGSFRSLKLKGGQVRDGLSGAPLLNVRRGRVCGVVESSRNTTADVGGYGVPIFAFHEQLPELYQRSESHHRVARTWPPPPQSDLSGLPLLPLAPSADATTTASPARLLQASRRVVPFVGSEEELDQLVRWRDADPTLSVAVIYGPGGAGKTRLAHEVCAQAEECGWTVGRFSPGAGPLDALAALREPCVVMVDYAETRPGQVTDLLVGLVRALDRPATRVLLVMRQALENAELTKLFATGDGHDMIEGLFDEPVVVHLGGWHDRPVDAGSARALPASSGRRLDRGALFNHAVDAFARARRRPVPTYGAPDLEADHYERPLFVLARALLFVDEPQVDLGALGAEELLLKLLDHEEVYWKRWNDRLGAGVAESFRRQTVAMAALFGADDRADAVRLVRLLDSFKDSKEERAEAVALWLSSLYGPGRLDDRPAIAPLEPDLLAEVLVAAELSKRSDLIVAGFAAALTSASNGQLHNALTVLGRATVGRPSLAHIAYEEIDERLPQIVPRLVGRYGVDRELVAALRLAVLAFRPVRGAAMAMDLLPEGHPVLAQFAAELSLIGMAGWETALRSDPGPHARLASAFNDVSRRLADVGFTDKALEAVDLALGHYRGLVAVDRARFLPGLASALTNRSAYLGDLGNDSEALPSTDEAITCYRGLVQDDSQYVPKLASSLNNRSVCLSRLGRPGEALATIAEAVIHYQALAAADPARYGSDLASALNNQSVCLEAVGERRAALASVEQAVDVRRQLARTDRDRFLPELATTLANLANRLGELGLRTEALSAAEEAVRSWKELEEAYPGRFRLALAISTEILSTRLADSGRPFEALTSIEEAASHYHELARANQRRYLPDLARLLTNVSVRQRDVGQLKPALRTAEAALAIRRELAEGATRPHLPDLAKSLEVVSSLLVDARGAVELPAALAAITEAVGHYRTLVAENPAGFLPDLARALDSLSTRAANVHRPEDAVAAVQEAVVIRRALAAEYPQRFLPDLASSLSNLSNRLADVGRNTEALRAIDEAIAHYRVLFKEDPERFRAEMATALNNGSDRLATLGRGDDALASVEQAVGLRRALARARPDRYVPELAASFRNLMDRLHDAGRGDEVVPRAAEVLRDHAGNAWATGAILFHVARWLFEHIGVGPALASAWAAFACLDGMRDTVLRAQARMLLRSMRATDAAAFDDAWGAVLALDPPVWLQVATIEVNVLERVAEWLEVPDWDECQAFVTSRAGELLTDGAVAALEHLLDSDPGDLRLQLHLSLLLHARANGIEEAYAARPSMQCRAALGTWMRIGPRTPASENFLSTNADTLLRDDAEGMLGDLVGESSFDPYLLVHLGLLVLARERGVTAAHQELRSSTARTSLPEIRSGGRGPALRQELARARARLVDEDAGTHFAHALVAVAAGSQVEADAAAVRCRDRATWPERERMAQHLDAVAAECPDLARDLARIKRLLRGGAAPPDELY